jgi:hypothetical protein
MPAASNVASKPLSATTQDSSIPNTTALELLLQAYRDEIVWLMTRAKEYEAENSSVAADYVHRANNLQAIIDDCERLKNPSLTFVSPVFAAPV